MSHLNRPAADLPDVGVGGCCWEEIVHGPGRCTCWTPTYDLEQADPDPDVGRWLAAGIQPVTRARMCPDCAYRPGSPERSGDGAACGDTEFLDRLAAGGDRFWCHQGIRRPVTLTHPTGAVVPGHPAAYDPPIAGGVPYRADGTPAELCAGWAARRRALTRDRQ